MACLTITKCRELLERAKGILEDKQKRRKEIEQLFIKHTGETDSYKAHRFYAAYAELGRKTACCQAFILEEDALRLVDKLLHQKVPVLPLDLLRRLTEEDNILRGEIKAVEQKEKFLLDTLVLLTDLEADEYESLPTKGKCGEPISIGNPSPSEARASGCSDSEGGTPDQVEHPQRPIDEEPF